MNRSLAVLLALLAFTGTATAATLTEDFEDDDAGGFGDGNPTEDWYTYAELSDVGKVAITAPIIEGTQSVHFTGNETTDATDRRATFTLTNPTQITNITFFIDAATPSENTVGTQQVITLESTAPTRKLVQFFVFCRDAANPTGCELRVRFEHLDTTGQVLINTTVGDDDFKIHLVNNWLNSTYQLFVDDVNDGHFPFLELPRNFARIRIHQYRGDVPLFLALDDITLTNGIDAPPSAVQGDLATGLQGFASDIRFTTDGSRFFIGLLLFIVLIAAVLVPLFALGLDNTLTPTLSFYSLVATFFLIDLEWWPDWIGIGLIIACAAIIGQVIRVRALGITNASNGGGLVVGSLGYFIIASSLLAFSGYATDTIAQPLGPPDQQNDDGGNVTATQQTFVGAVAECIFTGGAFTFGLVGDCDQDTVTTTWDTIVSTAGDIFGWVRAGVDWVFQLLTFSLPIPVVFNLLIVGPPAGGLAAWGIATIRGTSS